MPLTKATQNVIAPNICTTDTAQTVSGAKSFTGNVTTANLVNGTSLCFRNKIINGDMVINQREPISAISSQRIFTINASNAFQYTLDRWQGRNETAASGAFTVNRDSGSDSGFSNSLRVLTTTANTNLSAGAGFCITQNIEGHNIADLKWGTPNALPITISFWYQSSFFNTNLPLVIQNDSYDMIYAVNFVTNASSAWEKKTITIPGPTTGTWLNDNGIGMRIIFGLGSGSSRRVGSTGSWISGGTQLMTGTSASEDYINFANRTLNLTGVQIEAGSVATPFEFRSIGTELALCQRYCMCLRQDSTNRQVGMAFWTSTTGGQAYINHISQMRTIPTFSFTQLPTTGRFNVNNGNTVVSVDSVTLNSDASNNQITALNFTTASGGTAGVGTRLFMSNSQTNTIATLSAEL
jgi:hypothetical protein